MAHQTSKTDQIKELIVLAKLNFETQQKRIDSFKQGYNFYLHYQDNAMVALMLHQVIELRYRTAELLLLGKEKASHSIRKHHKLMKRYIPGFGEVFRDDSNY